MTQVHVVTLDPEAVYALENTRAEIIDGKPPKDSPYKLTKELMQFVDYVPGTSFQSVVDRITGKRYKTRQWLRDWPAIVAENYGNIVKEALDPYVGKIIQLDGVDDVFGSCYHLYWDTVGNHHKRAGKGDPLIRKYGCYLLMTIHSGKPLFYQKNSGEFELSYSACPRIAEVVVQSQVDIVRAIASRSSMVVPVDPAT